MTASFATRRLAALAPVVYLWFIVAGGSSLAAETLYRITLLTQTDGYVVVSGGDAIRIAPDCKCAKLPAGTVAVMTLDDQNRVTELRRSAEGDVAGDKLPAGALVVDPRSSRTLAANQAAVHSVTVKLEVTVPPDTPQTDDLYLSTDRSGWGAAELRMQRVDALHWEIDVRLPVGTQLLYRYSRGTFATMEADRAGQLAAPRKIVAKEGLVQHDTILRFADTQ